MSQNNRNIDMIILDAIAYILIQQPKQDLLLSALIEYFEQVQKDSRPLPNFPVTKTHENIKSKKLF